MVQDAQSFFQVDLRTPAGEQAGEALLPFADLEAACCDVYASMPDVAAELIGDGIDPMACSYLVRDEAGALLLEIAFTELVPGARRRAPGDDNRWLAVNARLKRRSEEAVAQTARAASRLSALIAEAGALVGLPPLDPSPLSPTPGAPVLPRGSVRDAAAPPASRDRPAAASRRPG